MSMHIMKRTCHGVSSWPLVLFGLRCVGSQEYMKLSDVYRMYGRDCHDTQLTTTAQHGLSLILDTAVPCEVPLLSLSITLSITSYLSLSLSPSLSLAHSILYLSVHIFILYLLLFSLVVLL